MSMDVTTELTTAFEEVGTNIASYVKVALPAALGIAGSIIAVKFAIKFFKGIVKSN